MRSQMRYKSPQDHTYDETTFFCEVCKSCGIEFHIGCRTCECCEGCCKNKHDPIELSKIRALVESLGLNCLKNEQK